jgi:filamentous hemagglutinin family protein
MLSNLRFGEEALKAVMVGSLFLLPLVDRGAIAQVSPDTSLLNERSSLTPNGATVNGQSVDVINGGAVRGGNLFHSFSEFNVGQTERLYFANPAGIDRIISRVTGRNASNIDGTLGVLGSADLFLINPNGIVFGSNARLDVQGSFIASTADHLDFANGFEFSARNPQVPPLLTINVPLGLQMGQNPGSIVNRSRSVDPQGNVVGLQVQPGKTLGFVGGDLQFAGGSLTAPEGRIELGATAGSRVALTPSLTGYRLGAIDPQQGKNIQFTGQSSINTSGQGGGAIQAQGQHVLLTEGSKMLADTLGDRNGIGITIRAANLRMEAGTLIAASTFGAGMGGDINIHATDTVQLVGAGFNAFQTLYVFGSLLGFRQFSDRQNGIFAGTGSTGKAGSIAVKAGELRLTNGFIIDNGTFGQGDAGDILVEADIVDLSGSAVTSASLGLTGLGAGNSGEIAIQTRKLILQEGGAITTSTITDGDAGTITINATELVELLAFPKNALAATSITSLSFGNEPSATIYKTNIGKAGNINITTRRVLVRDGAAIDVSTGSQLNPLGGLGGNLTIHATESIDIIGGSQGETTPGIPGGSRNSLIGSRTFNRSPAGSVNLTTGKLTIRNGGELSAATISDGQGGTLNIVANTIELDGVRIFEFDGVRFERPSSIVSNSGVPTVRYRVNPIGNGGNLNIRTHKLIIRDGAKVAVNSLGEGDAGTLRITAGSIRLDTSGSLSAETASGAGGNIQLVVDSVLLLRRASSISAEAGNNGAGGNIAIDAGFVVANLPEDSDIQANAFRGRGGNINISTQGIFGIQFQPEDTPQSDITASSRFGIGGVVNLTTPDLDPSRGTTELPEGLIDTNGLIARSCVASTGRQGSFVEVGSGGIPTQPDDLSSSNFATYALIPDESLVRSQPAPDRSATPIAEIDGVYQLANGKTLLGRSCH